MSSYQIRDITDLDTYPQSLLLKCISGSRAYGLSTPQSDTDIRGVFILPKKQYYGFTSLNQLNNNSQDEVYYEIKRFIELLVLNNPNILELLNSPADCILYRHPLMDLVDPKLFLSKLCRHTFAGYAQSQVKKAKGLNKKIVNPVEKERKSLLDFCFVIKGQRTVLLIEWLNENNFSQEDCGLVNLPHMRDVFALFHNSQLNGKLLNGIVSGEEATDVSLSSVPAGITPLAIMSFNKDSWSQYCRTYREYWDWVEKRNETRYENTIQHGKNYDAKNMMHTFRLLAMAEEIALYKEVRVRRSDRDFLLKVRKGEFDYEDLVKMAVEKTMRIEELYKKTDLPDAPDRRKSEELLVFLREKLYSGQ